MFCEPIRRIHATTRGTGSWKPKEGHLCPPLTRYPSAYMTLMSKKSNSRIQLPLTALAVAFMAIPAMSGSLFSAGSPTSPLSVYLSVDPDFHSSTSVGFEESFWPEVWGVPYTSSGSSITLSSQNGATMGFYRVIANQDPSLYAVYTEHCRFSSPGVTSWGIHLPGEFNTDSLVLSCGRFQGPGGYDRFVYGTIESFTAEADISGQTVQIGETAFWPFGAEDTLGEALMRIEGHFNIMNRTTDGVGGSFIQYPLPDAPGLTPAQQTCLDECEAILQGELAGLDAAFDACKSNASSAYTSGVISCKAAYGDSTMLLGLCLLEAHNANKRRMKQCNNDGNAGLDAAYARRNACRDACFPSANLGEDLPFMTIGPYRLSHGLSQ